MRRTYINIAVFGLVASALIMWSVTNFLHLDVVEDPDLVVVEFAESPGLRAGYEVTYLGHAVGRIRGVRLQPGISEVTLAIDNDADLPADVLAFARRRSAIGEPYVDLEPVSGADLTGGDRLADGDRIPTERSSSPLQYGDLFRSLDELVQTIDADALGTVVEELAIGLDGRGDDIRRIVTGTHDLTTTLAANGDEFVGLIDDVATLTSLLAQHRDSLGDGIDSLAKLADALDEARPAITELLDEVPSTIGLLNRIMTGSQAGLVCTIDGLSILEMVLDAEGQAAATELLHRSAAFADVTTLVRDPDDGIFRLLVTINSGEPETVVYDDRAPLPETRGPVACPASTTSVEGVPVASAAAPGAGGTRPAADAPGLGAPPRPGVDPNEVASGSSGISPDDPLLARLIAAALPWLALALLAALVTGFVRARRRGAVAQSDGPAPLDDPLEDLDA